MPYCYHVAYKYSAWPVHFAFLLHVLNYFYLSIRQTDKMLPALTGSQTWQARQCSSPSRLYSVEHLTSSLNALMPSQALATVDATTFKILTETCCFSYRIIMVCLIQHRAKCIFCAISIRGFTCVVLPTHGRFAC